MKGISTGWNDRYHFHDNSFWVSFGESATLTWIRRWLLLLMGTMVATFVCALVHLIVVGVQAMHVGPEPLLEKAMPLLYALLAAMQYIWLLAEPFAYLFQGSKGGV